MDFCSGALVIAPDGQQRRPWICRIVVVGPPGVDKSFLAQAIGLALEALRAVEDDKSPQVNRETTYCRVPDAVVVLPA